MKHVAVFSTAIYSDAIIDWITCFAAHLWWVRMSHDYQVLIPDGHLLDAKLMQQCRTERVPFTCVGMSKKSKLGADHYMQYRMIGGETTKEALDSFIVVMADVVICLQDTFIPSSNVEQMYYFAKRFKNKRIAYYEFGANDPRSAATVESGLLPGAGLARVSDYKAALYRGNRG